MEALGSFPSKSAGCFIPKSGRTPWVVVERNSPEPSRSPLLPIPRGLASAGGSQDRGNGKMAREVKYDKVG